MNETLFLVDQQEEPGSLVRFTIEHEVEREIGTGTLRVSIVLRAHDTCGPVTAGRAYLTSATRPQFKRRLHHKGFSDWHIHQIKADMEEAAKSNPLYRPDRPPVIEGPSFAGAFYGSKENAEKAAQQMVAERWHEDGLPFINGGFPY